MLRKLFALALMPCFFYSPLASAKPCRDSSTRQFAKCEKPKPVRCRDAKGRFTKCKKKDKTNVYTSKPMAEPATPQPNYTQQ